MIVYVAIGSAEFATINNDSDNEGRRFVSRTSSASGIGAIA
jgi:hypothetical protein